MSFIRAALAGLLLIFAVPLEAGAEERITRFASDVRIRPDSTLDVTETIDVIAENVSINRGIYRDFPTRYRGRKGSQVRVGFELQGVTRNGTPESAAVEPIRNGVRVRIGSAETVIEPGEHRYVIRYRTTRQLGRFSDFDEIYWNVTGTGWVFPIEMAEARIHLPAAARFGQRAVYTGPQGAQGTAAEVVDERPGYIHFRTTAPLGPYEGLTVSAAFPKGVVGDADGDDQARWWLADYGPPLVGLLSLLGLGAFYFIAWKRAGRDPRPGTVVPIFSPPDDLSPAAIRYVRTMKTDNRAFAAALVDFGVRGHVRIVEEDGGWLSSDKVRLERLAQNSPLPQAEEAMLGALAGPGEAIVLEQKNHAKFIAARKALDTAFKSRFENVMFKRNWGWALAGLALFAAALWVTSAAVVAASGTLDLTVLLVALAAFATTVLLLLLIQSMAALGKCLMVGGVLLSGAVWVSTGLPILSAAIDTGWWQPLALPLLALPLVVSAFWWIPAPTREGRLVLDRIAGFRQYLSVAERERLDRMTPPDDTPELFERYLPYAIALGVENRWADRFSGVLAAAAAQGRQGFSWYSGRSDPWSEPGRFVGRVGSSLASTVSSAATAPGSRSGSGGGGSSGGGGGGGGGGGW